MAVEDSEAPGTHHEQAGSREQDAGQSYGKLARLTREPAHEQRDEDRRAEHPDHDEHRHDEREDRRHGARDAIRLYVVAVSNRLAVDRDE